MSIATFFVHLSYGATIPTRLTIVAILAGFAILFLQSGLDKIMDRKGNLEWLTGHFANSPLSGMVPTLLTVITVMEMFSGVISAFSMLLSTFMDLNGFWMPFASATLCSFTLLMLFFGQRMAKDYAGAAGIVPYLIGSIGAMIYFW